MPRRVRFAEIDARPEVGGELNVVGHLAAPIPCQRAAQAGWKRTHRFGDSGAGRLGGVVVRQVDQQHVAGRPLGECPDRGAVRRTGAHSTWRPTRV